MSVELKLTGSCKKCEYIDLDLDYFLAGNRKIYRLRCEHEPTCYHMQREHEEAMRALKEFCAE